MSDILSTTTTFISSFVNWITSMTLSLISNPFVAILLGLLVGGCLLYLIIDMVIKFLKDIGKIK